MTELFHRPGFLGTSANFLTDMTLVLSLFVAAALTAGFLLARRRQYGVHRVVQTVAVTINAVLVLWLMILPFKGFILPGLPARLVERFYAVTTLHAVAGALALGMGVFVVLRANGLMPKALQFRNYKRVMRISYGLYLLATLIGILVYFTWFVWNPTPPVFG
ncbi:MAG TPA: DUF420 domain-containing protein [Anaerolineales bacterium]|nr:DUF420 domain-containing protein [Anaerolineales bacterium]